MALSKPIVSASFNYETLEEKLDVKAKGAQLFIGIPKEQMFQENRIALTPDAVSVLVNNGHRVMIEYLIKENIPATLFINARWIDANPEVFASLAANPLFEIANHGLLHRPASVNGKGIYGIAGTRSLDELVDEIEVNALKI